MPIRAGSVAGGDAGERLSCDRGDGLTKVRGTPAFSSGTGKMGTVPIFFAGDTFPPWSDLGSCGGALGAAVPGRP